MIQRMIGAALLNAGVYQELRDNPTATLQAFGVIALSSIALTIGSIQQASVDFGFVTVLSGFSRALFTFVVEWFVLSLVAYWVGTVIMRRMLTFPGMLRTIGFANTPYIFYVLVALSFLEILVVIVVLIWIIFAIAMALREMLQVSGLTSLWMSVFGYLVISFTIRIGGEHGTTH